MGAKDETRTEANRAAPTGTPRWVKAMAIVATALVLLAIIHLITGGGPGMHGMRGPPGVG